MRSNYILFFFAALLLISGCKEAPPKQAIETPEISFTKEGELSIYRAGTDSLLVNLDIEIADTEYETQTGLMYRSGMQDNQGMFFIFEEAGWHSFYMKNTEFALDIFFIDEDFRVRTIRENAQPLDESGISSGGPIQYVLEVNAGLRDRWGVSVGDSLVLERK